MNSLAGKLLGMLLLSGIVEHPTVAMNKASETSYLTNFLEGVKRGGQKLDAASWKNMSKSELLLGVSTLPNELKWYIMSLLLEGFIEWDFKPYKTIDLGYESSCGAFSSNGRSFIAGDLKGCVVQCWDVETGEVLTTFKGHMGAIRSVAFSNDGKCLSGSEDETACVWDSTTGKLITTFKGHSGTISSVAFSPDGGMCLTGSYDKTACVWDSTTGKLITTLKGHTDIVSSVAFSPDGETCLTGSWDKTACLWNSKTGKLVMSFTRHHEHSLTSVAFSPTEKTVFTGSYDKTACMWDSRNGLLLRKFGGPSGDLYVKSREEGTFFSDGKEHTDTISSVACSPDGKNLITGSLDRTACVWSTAHVEKAYVKDFNSPAKYLKGGLVALLEGYPDAIHSVAFSADGEIILSIMRKSKAAYILKRVPGFNCLAKENERKAFALFLKFYPIFQKMDDSTQLVSDKAIEMPQNNHVVQVSNGSKLSNKPSERKAPVPVSVKVGISTQGKQKEEALGVKSASTGLDVNSGDQQNCTLS